MRLIYVIMQYNYVDLQHNAYVNMWHKCLHATLNNHTTPHPPLGEQFHRRRFFTKLYAQALCYVKPIDI